MPRLSLSAARVLLCLTLMGSALALLAGALRLEEIRHPAPGDADVLRFLADPLPFALHVAGFAAFCLLGAMQVHGGLTGMRGRARRQHRALGLPAFAAGLLAAGTGLWLTLAYPPGPLDGALLKPLRLVVSLAALLCLALSARALLRGDYPGHGAWMLRAWALSLGAVTQVLTGLPLTLALGEPQGLSRTLFLGFGWGLNLALAEWLLRRRPAPARISPPLPGR